MTDDELVAATDLAIHDALRDQETKFAAGKAALSVATPEIRRRLIEEMRNPSNEMIRAGASNAGVWGSVMLFGRQQAAKPASVWQVMLDAFAKEHGDDR